MRLDGNSLRSAWADAKSGRRTDAVVVLAMAEELLRRRLQAKLWDEVKVWWEARIDAFTLGPGPIKWATLHEARAQAGVLRRMARGTHSVRVVKCTKRVRRRKK
jgi:hypothetical protein